jgi:hypothetical protein
MSPQTYLAHSLLMLRIFPIVLYSIFKLYQDIFSQLHVGYFIITILT